MAPWTGIKLFDIIQHGSPELEYVDLKRVALLLYWMSLLSASFPFRDIPFKYGIFWSKHIRLYKLYDKFLEDPLIVYVINHALTFKQPAILKIAMDDIVKDADRLVSSLANKVAKTFDFSIRGASSRSCNYVLNTLIQCDRDHNILGVESRNIIGENYVEMKQKL
ncbi:hypothetical protein RHSIM_Rhsim09G0078800 [Rhododendron simsii]|uniref:Uncharacterized protein n=1 Tax=Rhododendron simsii TaxID=118357 RepID=A0A834GG47_RHOSS|nr:hypothetical protein RHSIM_Rhsim09G0078800 [Rhododendron simsii]